MPLPKQNAPRRGPFDFGGEGRIDGAHPCAPPLRGRYAVQIGNPADLSNMGSHPDLPALTGPVVELV